ncbi:fungal-specific transcription factor domain-containing protein [Bisporella sp. PMI_857]|nr:fungal-specific transcription factor domain-containing protein [Bisporella sp. PMI_857]
MDGENATSESRGPFAKLGSRVASRASSRKKPLACQRCRLRKVKCPGGAPCDVCRKSGCGNACVYIGRNRQVKVAEKYLQEVLAENERLKRRNSSQTPHSANNTTSQSRTDLTTGDANVRNPLVKEPAWFQVTPYETSKIPIYIGEAACTAFATRLRQFLCLPDRAVQHIPRINYVKDENLSMPPDVQVIWPTQTHARLLVKVVMSRVNRAFHVCLIDLTMAKLDQIYRDSSFAPTSFTSKLFALFAVGEVYSCNAKDWSGGEVPGLAYFRYASRILQVLPERPDLDVIETLVLFSFYSHNLNRRHSAYSWIGSALRLAVSVGLHHNLPSTVQISPFARQHRICLWWTIYTCDKMWGSKLSHPLEIQEMDMSVDQPYISALDENERAQLPEPAYMIASIQLAKITGSIISTIYRRNNPPPFILSVQKILRDLKSWIANLPETVKLVSGDKPRARHIVSLHLSFNQCVILATRPVLLHVLEISRTASQGYRSSTLNQTPSIIQTLAEACLHAARHSNELLTQIWADGTLATYTYFGAQYLFSSAVILAISTLLSENGMDRDLLRSSAQLLQFMADSGNLSALEFCGHLDHVKLACDEYRSRVVGSVDASTILNDGQPPMRDFLTQDEVPFEFISTAGQPDSTSIFYDWPAQGISQ